MKVLNIKGYVWGFLKLNHNRIFKGHIKNVTAMYYALDKVI